MRPILVCAWCVLFKWRLVELMTVNVTTKQGAWHHWYCTACGRGGHG